MNHDSEILFSIVIPSYNRGHLIRATIESALNQQFQNYEIIVIDDGSTDSTASVVADYNDPRLTYYYKENGERASARNFGIMKSRGRYITFCDSDDLLFPDYLANAFNMLNTEGPMPWFHLGYEIRRPSGSPIRMSWMSKNFMMYLAKGNPLSCMGIFVDRDIIRENLFNENRYLSGSEDWELWLRIAARYPIRFDKRISSALIIHDERSVINTNELKLKLRKYLSIGYAFDDEPVRKQFSKYRHIMVAYFDTYIALHLLLAGYTRRGLYALLNGFRTYPACIFERRFIAIIKYTLLNLIGGNKAGA